MHGTKKSYVERTRGTILAVVASGLAAAGVAGCHRTKVQPPDNVSEAEVAGAAGFEDAAAGEILPPPPIVAADPNIPLHESVVGAAPVPADYSAPVAPPAPVVEEQPSQPDPDDAWVAGYWWWSLPLGRYVWVSGAWRRPPPDQVWFPGAWSLLGARYTWTPGCWGPHGYGRVYIDFAPPALRYEDEGAPPSVGFVWTPGYYGYRGGSYVWVGGSWLRPPAEGLFWIEPRYVNITGRYTLLPGRWDFAPERRGIVYRPDIDVRPGAHLRLAPVPQGVVSAHARFDSAAARAIAHGATRMPNGGYAMHADANVHDNGRPHTGEGQPGAGPTRESEPHGPGAPRAEGAAPIESHHGVAAPAHGPAPAAVHPAAAPAHMRPPERKRP